jgi:ubiquinone biosynthesis protein
MEVGRLLGGAPELLSRGAVLAEQLDAITRDGLVLAPQTVADIGRAQARRNRWTAAALWAIALLLGWLIYLLVR